METRNPLEGCAGICAAYTIENQHQTTLIMRTERFLHEAVGVSLGKIDFSVVPLHVQYIFCGADCPEL